MLERELKDNSYIEVNPNFDELISFDLIQLY